MEYIEGNDFKLHNTCVAFGCFDGLHLGHRAVVDRLLETAAEKGLTSVVLTYDYDESLLKDKKILATQDEKKHLFCKNCSDVLISYKVNGPVDIEQFIREVLVEKLDAKVIVAGSDDENIDALRAGAGKYGYTLEECDTVKMDGEPVTCERILKELQEGKLEIANEMLGQPYLIIGEVMHGKALGRTVGMPTANIGYKPYKQLPSDGVYGTISDIEGKRFKGLTNLGHRPTVDNFDYVTVEEFILDFDQDIYGKTITLEVHATIRGIRKFKDLEEVKLQVNKDIESIRSYFESVS